MRGCLRGWRDHGGAGWRWWRVSGRRLLRRRGLVVLEVSGHYLPRGRRRAARGRTKRTRTRTTLCGALKGSRSGCARSHPRQGGKAKTFRKKKQRESTTRTWTPSTSKMRTTRTWTPSRTSIRRPPAPQNRRRKRTTLMPGTPKAKELMPGTLSMKIPWSRRKESTSSPTSWLPA